MFQSAYLLLVFIALILTLVHATTNKVPLWIAVLLACVALLVGAVPHG